MRTKNPDKGKYISIAGAGRTLQLSYQKTQRLFLEGKIKGLDNDGGYWLEKESVVAYSFIQDEIRALEKKIEALRA